MVILGILAVCVAGSGHHRGLTSRSAWLFLISGMVGLGGYVLRWRDFPRVSCGTLLTGRPLAMAAGVLLIWKPRARRVCPPSTDRTPRPLFIAEGIFQIVGSFAYRDVIGPRFMGAGCA